MWTISVTQNSNFVRIRECSHLSQKDFTKLFRPLIFRKKKMSLFFLLSLHARHTCIGQLLWGLELGMSRGTRSHLCLHTAHSVMKDRINEEINYSKLWYVPWQSRMPYRFRDWAKEGVIKNEGRNHFLIKPIFSLILKELSRKIWRIEVFLDCFQDFLNDTL